MPSDNLSQRISEISKHIEILRTQSLSRPDKAADISAKVLDDLLVSLKGITTLVGGGMTEAEQDAFVKDKLACEHEKHATRQGKLLEATRKVLAQRDLDGLLQTVADAARELTQARYAATGHGYVNGVFTIGGASRSEEAMPCPPGEAFNVEKGGVYLDLILEKNSVRLTDAEMRSHPTWWGLPENHVPLRGLLGARLVDVNGQPNGILMASDKEDGGDFAPEDETILSQLAAIVSLALQHIEARLVAEKRLHKENREIALANRILEVFIKETGDDLYDKALNIVLEGMESKHGAFGYIDERGDLICPTMSKLVDQCNMEEKCIRYQRENWKGLWSRALQEKKTIYSNEPAVVPDGHLPILRNLASPILFQGNVIGLLNLANKETDYTEEDRELIEAVSNRIGPVLFAWIQKELRENERKQAEEALRESERRERERAEELATLLDAIPIPVFIVHDPDGTHITGNRAADDLLRNPYGAEASLSAPDETRPRHFRAVKDGRELQPDELPAQRAARGFQVQDFEFSLVFDDGTIRHVVGYGTPLRDDEGRPRGAVHVLVDITERKQAEEELERLASFPRLNPNPVVEVDLEGRVHFLNPAAKQLFPDLQGMGRDHPWLADWELVARIFRENKASTYVRDVSLGENWYQQAMYSLADAQRIRIYSLDITERKRAEEELRRAKDELEQRVHERTAELSQAKEDLEVINEELQVELEQHQKLEADLIKAKEAAEAATKAKAEFLANMSHEIRTPMNAVIGMTGLLLEEPLTPEQRDNIELIRINGDALMVIINDILDFSKMESDKVVLEEQPFNLRQCVEESLDLVAIKASEKGLNLAYTIDKNVPETIIGDPTRLRQILGNLLSNAVKFTDEGEVNLSVSGQLLGGANEVHFAVQDTGIGIPQDHMNLLFQPFSQMDPSTTRLFGGTGLGLAISKKLVELMGGKIWAESEEGKGSTFHFTIKTSSSQSDPQLAGVSPQLVGKSVLMVSENKTNRRILGKQVYEWGMIPMIAASGREALSWVQRGDDFDIAILDRDMQDMNGLELEKEILKYNKTLPLVLLTSIGQRIPPNHAYLTKPIKPSQLHKVLTEILSRQSAQRAVQSPVVSQPVQNSPLRILMAEDNVSSQKVALQMLKKLGYKADTVANGIEALQALERQHYDLVLMDVRMPEMDGLEATRIIRQRWTDNGPKIIAITAYALEGDREKFIEAGMDDYIAKPVQKEELAKVLSKYQPR